MLNNLVQVLTNFNQRCQEGSKALLVLRTENGEKKVTVIDKSQLSWGEAFLARLGFGNASLRNVAAFLEKRREDMIQNDTYENIKEVFSSVDEKIVKVNARSWVQKISPLLPVKVMAVLNNSIEPMTTYEPQEELEQTKALEGILDFSHVFSNCGAAYIADGTGHSNPDKQKLLKPVWDKFNLEFEDDYKQKVLNFKSKEDVFQYMKEVILNLNGQIESAGTASTFSMSILVEIKGVKYAASVHVGDSDLLHVTQNGEIHYITPQNEQIISNLELSSLSIRSPIFLDIREVQPGDKIYGISDGISKFLKTETLHQILLDEDIEEGDLLNRFKDAVKEDTKDLNTEECRELGITKYNALDKRKGSDDISIFVMNVT